MKTTITISGRSVGQGVPVFIIAEVGVNHNGDASIARAMVDAIADAGADCVKFQTFSAEEFVNSPDEVYEYISQGQPVRESMLEMFRRLELQRDEFAMLFEHARSRGLIPLSTPTDCQAVDLLDDLGAGAFKIGSDDLVYIPFLRYVADKGKPVILSTGMANEQDITRAVEAIRGRGNEQIILLHCVSEYPTPPAHVNLRKMQTLRERFRVPVGFSDHSWGITAAIGAVALDACVIEKHFTLSREMPGPDHHFSADPTELDQLVKRIRELEESLGSPHLIPTSEEREMAKLARRSVVAARVLEKGSILSMKDFIFQRPGTGLLPFEIDRLIGKRLKHTLTKGEQLNMEMLEL